MQLSSAIEQREVRSQGLRTIAKQVVVLFRNLALYRFIGERVIGF